MDDPAYQAFAVLCAVGFLPGFIAGWLVRSWMYGCAGLVALLAAAIGILTVTLVYFLDFSLADDWAGIFLVMVLFIIFIVWIAVVIGWFLARSIQAVRQKSRPLSSVAE